MIDAFPVLIERLGPNGAGVAACPALGVAVVVAVAVPAPVTAVPDAFPGLIKRLARAAL